MKTCFSTIRLTALIGLAYATAPLYSTTIEYSSRSTWQLAVSNVVTTTFDVAAPGYTPPAPGFGIGLVFGGVILNGVTFQGFNNNAEYGLQIVTAGPSSTYYDWGTGGTILRGDLYQGALGRLHISLPNAVTAWGTDLMLGSTPGGNVLCPDKRECRLCFPNLPGAHVRFSERRILWNDERHSIYDDRSVLPGEHLRGDRQFFYRHQKCARTAASGRHTGSSDLGPLCKRPLWIGETQEASIPHAGLGLDSPQQARRA